MPFIGETGYAIPIDNDLDLTSFTDGQLVINRPDGTVYVRNVTSVNLAADGSGAINYPVQAGDFTVDGIYSIQFKNTSGGTVELSDIGEFYVGVPCATS